MSGKIASFMLTLALIGWRVFEVVKGNHSALTWILLVLFSLVGLFELCDIIETGKKKSGGQAGNADAAGGDAQHIEAEAHQAV